MPDLDVVEGLRSWSRGSFGVEAGVELLVRAFGGRFADSGWPWIQRCDRPGWYWVDADAIPSNIGVLSAGERPILVLAGALIGNLPMDDLGTTLAYMGRTNLELVLAAVAHAGGSHQHSGVADDSGQFRLVRLPALFGWPADPPRVG